MLGPRLQGEKVTLRPTQLEDLPLARRWFEDAEVIRTLLMRFTPSEKQEEEWYERVSSSDNHVLWIIATTDDKAIGSTGLHEIDWINRRATSGLVIGERDEWGKGYASEAVKLRTGYAFEDLGLERLETNSITTNIPMHRALEKSGYRKIGCQKHFIWRNGVWHDTYLFELLREEWMG